MTEREELEKAIAALDQQRTVLGETAVEAALAGLRHKLSALEGSEPVSREQVITRFMPKALADKMSVPICFGFHCFWTARVERMIICLASQDWRQSDT